MSSLPRVALWFRYGPAEHTEMFHAMPAIVAELARHAEVHYFGLRTDKPVPAVFQKHAIVHTLPFRVNRLSTADKLAKTALWLLCIPWMARTCRRLGVAAVYMDETVPLSAGLARLFFRGAIAITVADFFVDIYFRGPLLRPLGAAIRRADFAAWRHLPLIFTRAANTREFLAAHGVPAEVVHPVYDPCDFSVYHPVPRAAPRSQFGFTPSDVVLVHHGILHPNKGNDRILRALAQVKETCLEVRYLLVGDGPDMRRLRTLTHELNLESRVTFSGWLPKLADVNEALNAGDIGLVMRVGRKSDDFHMTGALVHSMACGLPILGARLAGVCEAVREGEEGLLFDPDNMDAFIAQLIRLARDAELRERLGRQALARAQRLFDMATVTDMTVRPLLELVRTART